jgi:hypothetical protein
MLWITFAIAAAIAALLMLRRSERKTVVLGQQLADAHKAEAARLATGTGPSPMPKGGYDSKRGDFSLVAVSSQPLDAQLRDLTRQFRSWEPKAREDARSRISMDEHYPLIHFAKRSAVLALNEDSAERCEDGFTALAMIDETRIDPRDAAWAAGLLSHAVTATRGDRKNIVERAIALATPGMAGILRGFRQPTNLSNWRYAEIRTGSGIGLIQSGSARYEPTFNLSELALRLADTLNKGRYVTDVEIAVEVPAAWFAKERRSAVEGTLARSRGAVEIRGTLRKEYSPAAGAQMFFQWIVEVPTESEAKQLVEDAGSATSLGDRICVGVSSGRLFGLLVAGSFMQGVEPFESRETLAELAEQTRVLLAEAAAER